MSVSRKSHKERLERITGRKVDLHEGRIYVAENWVMINGRKRNFKKSAAWIVEKIIESMQKEWMTAYEASTKSIISIGCGMKYLALMYDEGMVERRVKGNGAYEYRIKGGSGNEKARSVVGCRVESGNGV